MSQKVTPVHLPRILFVDDEPNVLSALRRNLRGQAGEWAMTFLSSPVEAAKAQAAAPFDVLVTDMRMPEMTGMELIKAVGQGGGGQGGGGPACIILTGAADLELAVAAINEAQVFRFYTKPAPIQQLLAGIREALEFRRRLPLPSPHSSAAALGAATLDRLPLAVLVLDGECRAVFMNSRGTRLVAARDGLLMSADGVCRALDVGVTRELHEVVRAAIDRAETNAMALPRPSSVRSLSLVAAPLAAAERRDAAVLMITDPDNQTLPSEAMAARLFDLTESEARLALAVTREPTLEEAAAAAGVTVATARSYLKRIFMKTGVNRQAELVRLILTAPVADGQQAGE